MMARRKRRAHIDWGGYGRLRERATSRPICAVFGQFGLANCGYPDRSIRLAVRSSLRSPAEDRRLGASIWPSRIDPLSVSGEWVFLLEPQPYLTRDSCHPIVRASFFRGGELGLRALAGLGAQKLHVPGANLAFEHEAAFFAAGPDDMLETGKGAGEIVEERGLKQTSDTGEIDGRIDEILAVNAEKVAEYRSGKQQLFGFFVGQVMKTMGGKANPKVVNERLRAKLDG